MSYTMKPRFTIDIVRQGSTYIFIYIYITPSTPIRRGAGGDLFAGSEYPGEVLTWSSWLKGTRRYLLPTYWAATWTLGILLNDDDRGRMMCFLVLPRNWEGTKICKHWLDWILVKQVWDCLGNYVLLIGSAPTRGIFAQQLQWKIGLAPCNTNHPGPPITYHLSDLHHKRYLLDLFGTCLNLGGQHILNVSYILEGEVPPPHPTWLVI